MYTLLLERVTQRTFSTEKQVVVQRNINRLNFWSLAEEAGGAGQEADASEPGSQGNLQTIIQEQSTLLFSFHIQYSIRASLLDCNQVQMISFVALR